MEQYSSLYERRVNSRVDRAAQESPEAWKKERRMECAVKFSLAVERWVARGMTVLAILIFGLVGYSYYDMYCFTRAGIDGVEYRDFAELTQINADTVAWLTLDGTSVDHPVVKGKDNFEYLDRDFYGKDYAGGTLFLDEQCSKDFAGEYQLIHGHHMSGGAMFGDLKKYLEEDFFRENSTGQLLTPDGNYDLKVVGAGVFGAYDSSIYRIDGKMDRAEKALRKCKRYREWKDNTDGTGNVVLSDRLTDETVEATGDGGRSDKGAEAAAVSVTSEASLSDSLADEVAEAYGDGGRSDRRAEVTVAAESSNSAGNANDVEGSGGSEAKLLALSTCSGDMDDKRIVVFCVMTKR